VSWPSVDSWIRAYALIPAPDIRGEVQPEDRSIGSGMVGGACKTAIGRRLKLTAARWRVKRLEWMAALCCLHYGAQYDAYRKRATG
jgi:hypothetical protein